MSDIVFKRQQNNIVIRIPIDTLVWAAQNHDIHKIKINDKYEFADELMNELEFNLGSNESSLSGFEQLLDDAISELVSSGSESLDFIED